jgi:hypothetical protein
MQAETNEARLHMKDDTVHMAKASLSACYCKCSRSDAIMRGEQVNRRVLRLDGRLRKRHVIWHCYILFSRLSSYKNYSRIKEMSDQRNCLSEFAGQDQSNFVQFGARGATFGSCHGEHGKSNAQS